MHRWKTRKINEDNRKGEARPMRKVTAMLLLVPAMALGSGLKSAQAQDSTPRTEQEKPVHAYRLDFSLNEREGEKKVNSRHYSINLNVPGDRQEVKIGTRVPVATGSFPASSPSGSAANPVMNTQFQYLDVGTHIWCFLKEHGDQLELQAGSEISNIDSGPSPERNGISNPVVRQIKIAGSTVAVPGKPIVIGSADDPTSNRQFELEVTVTKLK
jgi:hypothetical protein